MAPTLVRTTCQLSNLEVLCFVLGWHGGTVKMVADAVGATPGRVLMADYQDMVDLCRTAQLCQRMLGVQQP